MNRRVVIDRDRRHRQADRGRRHRRCHLGTQQTNSRTWPRSSRNAATRFLKRLDKLDDILAALKNLQGENDKLKSEVSDLRNQHNALKDQVNGLPKPLTEPQTQDIAHTEATGRGGRGAEAQQEILDCGHQCRTDVRRRPHRRLSISTAAAAFFSPFGGDGTHAVQAQGEYIYYPGRQEGQFDLGLVNRWGNLQAGAFGSFKYLNFSQFPERRRIGPGILHAGLHFQRAAASACSAPRASRTIAVLELACNWRPERYTQTYAQVVNQYGVDGLVGVWGNAYVQGNIGYLRRHIPGSDSSGRRRIETGSAVERARGVHGGSRFQRDLSCNTNDSGRIVFGFEVGNYIHPKEYGKIKTPVPMDVPRIRYELRTRRVGNSARRWPMPVRTSLAFRPER